MHLTNYLPDGRTIEGNDLSVLKKKGLLSGQLAVSFDREVTFLRTNFIDGIESFFSDENGNNVPVFIRGVKGATIRNEDKQFVIKFDYCLK
jgi:hypothetical protein